MFAALEVKLADDHSWLYEVTSVASPFLIATAAIIAALIAWKSAGNRLERELAHDREMRRDEYRRDSLDSALEIVTELAKGVRTFLHQLDVAEMMWTAADEIAADPNKTGTERNEALAQKANATKELRAEYKQTFPRLDELASAITRMKVRFGTGHAIPRAADKLLRIWKEQRVSSAGPMLYESLRKADEMESWKRMSSEAAAAYADLMVECEAWLKGDEEGGRTSSVPSSRWIQLLGRSR